MSKNNTITKKAVLGESEKKEKPNYDLITERLRASKKISDNLDTIEISTVYELCQLCQEYRVSKGMCTFLYEKQRRIGSVIHKKTKPAELRKDADSDKIEAFDSLNRSLKEYEEKTEKLRLKVEECWTKRKVNNCNFCKKRERTE
jgi:hypothetical protein